MRIPDDPPQKQKSLSTSSFYRQTAPKPVNKSCSELCHTIEYQQRQTQQSIQKLRLILDNKTQYLCKRVQESIEENKKVQEELGAVQRNLGEMVKSVYRGDKTKEWATEMEKTIHSIIHTHKDSNTKTMTKHINQYQSLQNTLVEIEQKRREQKKQREKEWQQVIDNIGETIIQAETVIEAERESMELAMSRVEKDILDMEEQSVAILQLQRKTRKQEHEYLTKLIQKIMDRLIC